MIDLEAGTIILPISLAMWLVALATFGLMMAGIAFVVATYSLFQRHNMHKETTNYVRLLTQANNYAAMLQAQVGYKNEKDPETSERLIELKR